MTSTPLTTWDISVIIPTLNEEGMIRQLGTDLGQHDGEIILVDGGSTDQTVAVAREAGFRVIHCPAGRGRQLNLGAASSRGKILLFLHADTRVPATFGPDILHCLATKTPLVGAFRLGVDQGDAMLRLVVFFSNLRSTLLRLPYGDQALFMRRTTFDRLGTFPDLEIMEDFALIRRARRLGRVITINRSVMTSPRRWQRHGVIRTTLINQLMILGFLAGVPAKTLALLYRRGLLFSRFFQ